MFFNAPNIISLFGRAAVEAKGSHDILGYGEVCKRLQCTLTGLIKVDHAQCIAFWGDETTYDHINLAIGQQVRLKTEGNSPIIG